MDNSLYNKYRELGFNDDEAKSLLSWLERAKAREKSSIAGTDASGDLDHLIEGYSGCMLIELRRLLKKHLENPEDEKTVARMVKRHAEHRKALQRLKELSALLKIAKSNTPGSPHGISDIKCVDNAPNNPKPGVIYITPDEYERIANEIIAEMRNKLRKKKRSE